MRGSIGAGLETLLARPIAGVLRGLHDDAVLEKCDGGDVGALELLDDLLAGLVVRQNAPGPWPLPARFRAEPLLPTLWAWRPRLLQRIDP